MHNLKVEGAVLFGGLSEDLKPGIQDTYIALKDLSEEVREEPEYIGVLTLLIEQGTPLETWVREGSFVLPDLPDILEETEILVKNIDSPGSVFRMNHASNYLDLRGTFNEDREEMLERIHRAMDSGRELRPEYYREL